MTDLAIGVHTFDDGSEAECLHVPIDNGVEYIPLEHVALFAALLGDNLDAYDQLVELARTMLSLGYAGGVEA